MFKSSLNGLSYLFIFSKLIPADQQNDNKKKKELEDSEFFSRHIVTGPRPFQQILKTGKLAPILLAMSV